MINNLFSQKKLSANLQKKRSYLNDVLILLSIEHDTFFILAQLTVSY